MIRIENEQEAQVRLGLDVMRNHFVIDFAYNATHGYGSEAKEVFDHINLNDYETFERLVMGVMAACTNNNPTLLMQKAKELNNFYCDQVEVVQKERS